MSDEFLCIKCVLKACDEASPQCLYRLSGRVILASERNKKLTKAIKQAQHLVIKFSRLRGEQDRSEYYRLYHLKNREKKIAAALEWLRLNPEKKAEAQKRHRAKKSSQRATCGEVGSEL